MKFTRNREQMKTANNESNDNNITKRTFLPGLKPLTAQSRA